MFIVFSADLTSTPKCTWTPDQSYYQINKYKYDGAKINFAAGGVAKAYGIKRRVTMGAHINFNKYGLAGDGCVDSCRY